MPPQKAEFIPFNSINEFMRPDFRTQVLQDVFQNVTTLPEAVRIPLNHLVRKTVTVPGFRNSSLAPLGIKIKSSVHTFEKNSQFTAAIIQAWSEIHPDLRAHTFNLLTDQGWTVLPVDADRTKLPGFLTVWPKGQDFETFNSAFHEKFQSDTFSTDQVSLMAVWLSGRLPIHDDGEPFSTDKEIAE